MAIFLIDIVKPKNNGSFPIVEAVDVLMPDGKRLSEGVNALPEVSETDNDKVMQVVAGKWTAVPLADSAVKTYIDEYINEALGGEY